MMTFPFLRILLLGGTALCAPFLAAEETAPESGEALPAAESILPPDALSGLDLNPETDSAADPQATAPEDDPQATAPEDDPQESAGPDQPEEAGGFAWTFRIRPDKPNLFLNLNGYAWHFKKGDESEQKVNDWPLGFGLTYELKRKKNYLWSVDGDLFFTDSNNDFAAALGSTILWRTGWIDIGARGGLLYKQNFVDDSGFPLGPVLLPTLQWELRYFALKVVYIPGIRKETDEQLFFQILFPLGGPG